MGSDLNITQQPQDYILEHGHDLHPVQKEIIEYNTSLGDIKRMQISISQTQLLHLIIKVSNIKKVLEIGTFTGLSTLSMSLALPDDGKIIALVEVIPSRVFISAAVAVTPSSMFNSAAVDVTPSNMFSSAAVEVTVVPFIARVSISAVPSIYKFLHCFVLVPKSYVSSVLGTI